MKKTRPALLACLVCASLMTAGCVASTRSYKKDPTVGQELIDLKAALERGAIDEAEYRQLKDDIKRRSRSSD